MISVAVEKARMIHARYPQLTFPIDMDYLVRAESCEVIDWPFLAPVREVKQGRWIGIAEGVSQGERRYLIAHALAHQLLHCGNQLSFLQWQKTTVLKQEQEAEIFAAHILMPQSELTKVIDLPVWDLAEYFDVPEELVRKRVSDFATEEELLLWEEMRWDNYPC